MNTKVDETFRIKGMLVCNISNNNLTKTTYFTFNHAIVLNKEEVQELINWLITKSDEIL